MKPCQLELIRCTRPPGPARTCVVVDSLQSESAHLRDPKDDQVDAVEQSGVVSGMTTGQLECTLPDVRMSDTRIHLYTGHLEGHSYDVDCYLIIPLDANQSSETGSRPSTIHVELKATALRISVQLSADV